MIESIGITNPDFFNDLNFIIMNDEGLSNRISILAEMNEELKPDSPWEDNPIICAILFILLLPAGFAWAFSVILFNKYSEYPILSKIIALFGVISEIFMIIFALGLIGFNCVEI